jgi:hypothetical protein
MKTFTFSALPPIQDFQFLTDSSGYILTQTGQLYRFTGQRTALVATPSEFTISHFHFRDQNHGALVGISRVAELPVQKGAMGAAFIPLVLLLWLIGKGYRQGIIRLASCLAGLLLTSGLLLSCSSAWQRYRTADPSSPHGHVLTHTPLIRAGFHKYFSNKGQKSFISLTTNQGSSWETNSLPTNFFPTALAAVGRNFVVGTYARQEAGTVPLHADGDLWLYGSDARRAPQLAANSTQHPYCIKLSRGGDRPAGFCCRFRPLRVWQRPYAYAPEYGDECYCGQYLCPAG